MKDGDRDAGRQPLSLGKRPRRRRALEERLWLALPGVFRWLARLVWRLPPRSRLRRYLFARNARLFYAGLNRDDLDFLLLRYHPQAEIVIGPALMRLGASDLEPTYTGPQGLRQFWARWREPWEWLKQDPTELIDLGDRVLALARIAGRGETSGVEWEAELAQLETYRDGLLVRQENFLAWQEGFAAAGLPDWRPL